MNLDELALAYELRQEGCSWKRIAQGLGGDALLIAAQVAHLISHGITKGLDGYGRKPGRPATYSMDIIRKAHDMKSRGSSWAGIARELDVDRDQIRKAHRYALNNKLIG